MLEEFFLFLLAFILISLVSGNNLPVCSGSMIGGKITRKSTGILIAIIGYISGLIVEGNMLGKGVYAIMPTKAEPFIIVALTVGIFVFIVAHKMRIPQSLSVNFTAILLGISMALGMNVNWGFMAFVVSFWILAPIVSILLIKPLMHSSYFLARRGDIWNVVGFIRLLIILLSFFAAFTLGANTIGLLYSSLPRSSYSLIVAIFAIIFGSIFLSGGELKRVSNEILSLRYINAVNSQLVSIILVELATLFGVPLSNSQTYIASIYGSGLSYKNRILLKGPIKSIAITWIGGALASFALSYVFAIFLLL
ncbi:MAG: inorganic phosphate transporter [Candidatus Micrarchaeia archaeon]